MATPNETVVMADEADMPGNAVTVPSRITNKKLPLARSRAGGWLCPRVYRIRVTPTLGGLGCSIWCRRGRCAAHARPEPWHIASVTLEATVPCLPTSATADGVGSGAAAASSRLNQAPMGRGALFGFPIA